MGPWAAPLGRGALAAALTLVPLTLCGCGGESGGGAHKPISKKSTVIIMRHCLRATPEDQISAKEGFNYYNNYSKDPWPPFEVPEMHCLPRGEDIVRGQGRWWKQRGGFQTPLRLIADDLREPVNNGQRDKITMYRFLEGLGLSEPWSDHDATVKLDHGMFVPPDTDACKSAKPSSEALKASAEEHRRANPPPEPEYSEAVGRLSEVLGEGAAGKWTDVACGVTFLPPTGLPMPSGTCDAAAAFSERLLMEWGSGSMTVGWGRVGLGEIPKLFLMQMWYFFNWWAPREVYRYWGAPIIRSVLRSLDEEGTTIYVGHDSDMMMLKGALGLVWDPAPYPLNVTLPGSMLRFVRDGDEVSASYVYVGDFNSTDGNMTVVEARFPPSARNTDLADQMAFSEFADLLREGSIEECIGESDDDRIPNPRLEPASPEDAEALVLN